MAISFEEIYAKCELERHKAEGEKRMNALNGLISQCQAEYSKLSERLHTSQVVAGVSTAVGVISALALAGASDAEEYLADAPDIFSTPQGHVMIGLAAAGFAVAGLSYMASNKILNKIDQNISEQDDLIQDYNAEVAEYNDLSNLESINTIKGAIHSELNLPDHGSVPTMPGELSGLPRIEVIDNRFPEPLNDDFEQ